MVRRTPVPERLGFEELCARYPALAGGQPAVAPADGTWPHLDVNHSEQATAVEFALDTALAAVPDLVDEAIDHVTGDTRPAAP